jgi:hypothetical protein
LQTLRFVGFVFGATSLLFLYIVRFRLRRLRNFDWLAGSVVGFGLMLLSVFPDAFNLALAFFSFEKGGGGRLIGLLIFFNLLLFALVFAALTRSNQMEDVINKLVRELAKQNLTSMHDELRPVPIYIVIPAYNEAENIAPVLERVPNEVFGLETKVLVVVDGATDHTHLIVNRLNHLAILHIIKCGGGAALKAGYEVALEQGADIVVTLDADGQHLPEEVPILVKPIVDGKADLVNGSRILGYYQKDNYLRAAGVVLFNWLVSILIMKRITDCSNSFRAIRASELKKLVLRESQFHTSELLLEAAKKGLRITEVPITVRARSGGGTKKPASHKYAWGFAKAVIRTWLR